MVWGKWENERWFLFIYLFGRNEKRKERKIGFLGMYQFLLHISNWCSPNCVRFGNTFQSTIFQKNYTFIKKSQHLHPCSPSHDQPMTHLRPSPPPLRHHTSSKAHEHQSSFFSTWKSPLSATFVVPNNLGKLILYHTIEIDGYIFLLFPIHLLVCCLITLWLFHFEFNWMDDSLMCIIHAFLEDRYMHKCK